jgi:hypothetical protein
VCATLDGISTCQPVAPSGPDVWYRFTAPCNGTLAAYTCPASYDTVLSVHSGCPGTAANSLACNDDSAYCGTAYPTTSYVSVPVVEGLSYLIRVAGYNSHSGTFVLNTALTCCYPNCDRSTIPRSSTSTTSPASSTNMPRLIPYANCDDSTISPILNVNDFSCFINKYAAGCP